MGFALMMAELGAPPGTAISCSVGNGLSLNQSCCTFFQGTALLHRLITPVSTDVMYRQFEATQAGQVLLYRFSVPERLSYYP